jgi:hypothetical protein
MHAQQCIYRRAKPLRICIGIRATVLVLFHSQIHARCTLLFLCITYYNISESIAHLQMLYPTATTPLLNELRGGSFTGLSRAEFKEQYPDIWKQVSALHT